MSTSAEQDLSHLGTEAKRLATRPDAERLQAMRRDRWIDYARAWNVTKLPMRSWKNSSVCSVA